MPKIDIAKATVRTTTVYPPEFQHVVRGREKTVLGDVAGLTQFGVNLTRLKPGAASALRHWHHNEDEFVYVLEGELVLIEDGGEVLLRPGDAAGFEAGVPNGHHLINKTQRDAVYLEVGTRAPSDRAEYPDVDLDLVRNAGKIMLTHKSGEPYP
jgi:uncharacterized cupin superfamily protein